MAGRQRPLGIAALEDKIVQHSVVTVLNQIYEEDFLGFSYGFRPGRSQHDALDALWVGIMRKKVNWILDAGVRGFFDNLSHEWLDKFIEHRIADRRMLRLIQKRPPARGYWGSRYTELSGSSREGPATRQRPADRRQRSTDPGGRCGRAHRPDCGYKCRFRSHGRAGHRLRSAAAFAMMSSII
jgi:Reverse transcriptase (RNA-dependent DNA polymerase)